MTNNEAPSPVRARETNLSWPSTSGSLTEEEAGARELHDPHTDAEELRLIRAASAILAQGEALLNTLDIERYTRQVPEAFNASIGGHYRHCLDHFQSLRRGVDSTGVDYDQRSRDVRIETDLAFALNLTRDLRRQLEQLPASVIDRPVWTRCEVSYAEGTSRRTSSSFGRELVYAITHAIHHYALISIMARLMDASLPGNFGVAPSTALHHAQLTTRG